MDIEHIFTTYKKSLWFPLLSFNASLIKETTAFISSAVQGLRMANNFVSFLRIK
jgi:hypothetical protein